MGPEPVQMQPKKVEEVTEVPIPKIGLRAIAQIEKRRMEELEATALEVLEYMHLPEAEWGIDISRGVFIRRPKA